RRKGVLIGVELDDVWRVRLFARGITGHRLDIRAFVNHGGPWIWNAERLGSGWQVGVDALVPAGKPALLAALRRGIAHAAGKHVTRRGGKVGERLGPALHGLQDLAQPPAFSPVAFAHGGTFALEVDVVDQ